MNKPLLQELLKLTPEERIELAQDLWDSIESDEMSPLTEEQKEEIERRHADLVSNPDTGSKWEDVKARLTARYR